ncbi:hypothetical protein [Priestia megaterium]|uniref:Uncharacterized protein n=1 Tax=Priestia megaterium TaxID=1404 RepID=A0A6M6DZZ2_PRIMG|nr:hypothetical protein [Priestia megaterium]QJX80453.1 hypothetical protein FDZ14_30665 [Priestia megaterium]
MNLTVERKKSENKKFIKFNKAGYDDMTSLYLSAGLKEHIKSLGMEYIEIGFNLEHKLLAIKINSTKGFCVYNGSGKLKPAIASTTLFRYLMNLLPEMELCTPYQLVKVDEETLTMSISEDTKQKINPQKINLTWIEESKYKRKKRPIVKVY